MAFARNGQPRRTLIRYHGAKWVLAPWILQHMPPHRIYVEPYGGGGSVLLQKGRAYCEIYNDLDNEIWNLFHVLRDPANAAELERLLRLTPFARKEFVDAYLPVVLPENPTPADLNRAAIERARKTIIKAFMGYGSAAITEEAADKDTPSTGFRSNSHRSGTTPSKDWHTYPEALAFFASRLMGVTLENVPAITLMKPRRAGSKGHDSTETLWYCDPPYVHSTRQKANKYRLKNQYRHEMTDEDHIELCRTLKTLNGMVLLSGYQNEIYAEELKGWWLSTKHAYADGAGEREECLWINPQCAERLPQLELLDAVLVA